MTYFPMFVNLNGEPVLIVGGGTVALRKLRKLEPYGADCTVVAPEISDEITETPGVTIFRRCFRKEDLEPRPVFVIAATDDIRVNHRIAALCREKNIPVNVADTPEECSFLFPALVQQGNFSAGICTGGASPTAAVYYKERLQELLPDHMDEVLSWLESKRREIKEEVPDQAKRAGIFRNMLDACLKKGAPLTEEEALEHRKGSAGGSVALVGAGCGKADLITVRGLRLLQQCEAVVYDDLIDPDLLDAAPESALRIYMGKRSGAHSASQEQINEKLIELAESGRRVVRLKGGDPYVFGRGGEEMLALKEAGISCQEVPGIPSPIGIAAEAGIPVTHRGASRGLHMITAHTSDTEDGLPADFDVLAKLEGTLVFLMGLKQLPLIAARLMAAGKEGNTPTAVLSGGNSPNPKKVLAPLSEIVQAVEAAKVTAPAIIMVGAVTALDLSSDRKPLEGVRIGITGTEEVAEKQQRALLALGAETVRVAATKVKPLPFSIEGKSPGAAPRWLVFTSGNGVRVFFSRLERQGIDPGKLRETNHLKFAVIGSATKAVLAQYGIEADLCPEIFTGEELANALVHTAAPGEEIFLLRSAAGSPDLPGILKENGFFVRDIATYELEPVKAGEEELPRLDYVTFSSAGGVRFFYERYHRIPDGVRPVCIGGVTAQALAEYGAKFLTAGEISAEGIVQAILEDRSSNEK